MILPSRWFDFCRRIGDSVKITVFWLICTTLLWWLVNLIPGADLPFTTYGFIMAFGVFFLPALVRQP